MVCQLTQKIHVKNSTFKLHLILKNLIFFKITVKPGVVDTRVQQCVKS